MSGRTQELIGPRWTAVVQLVTALGEQLSVEGLIGKTLDQVLVVLEADAVGIFTCNAVEHRLDLVAERGIPSSVVGQIAILPLDTSTLTARAAVTGEMQIAEDATRLPADLQTSWDLSHRHGFRSLVAAPLRAHGQLVGVMTFGTRQYRHFDQAEVAIVEAIAHPLASGILNAKAFESERQSRKALEAVDEATLAISAELDPQRVLQAIVERAREVVGARYAALGIGNDPSKSFDPWVFSGIDEQQAKAIGRHPRPVGLLGAVVAAGTMVRVSDTSKDPRFRGWPHNHPPMKSLIGVPIRLRGETIGNLYLGDKIDGAEFSAEDERAAASLAAHAAIAYRHAQLYQQAETERNRLRAVVDSSPLAIVFVEADTVYANRAAEELLGHPVVSGAGRVQFLHQFNQPDGQPLGLDELPSSRALRGESVVGTEVVLRRPDGREIPVLVSAEPIRNAEGVVTGAVALWQDITPLKLEQMREEFISLVAHELRSPIAVIAGYADVLMRKGLGETERRPVESIRISVRRLERMVGDLLDASRIEARRLEIEKRPVQLSRLVQDVVARLSEVITDHAVRVVTNCTPVVEADAGRIEQVLTNLLTNAAKYSPSQTKIDVSVECRSGETIVSVHNEGSGISPEDMPRLFTQFYRTPVARRSRTQGLGLGLHIARGLVEAHGGRIWATSEPEGGVTFCFALPTPGNNGTLPAQEG